MPIKLFDPLTAPRPATEPPQAEVRATLFRGYPEDPDPLKRDFRLFLIVLWRFLGFPEPTPIQMAMAHLLQHGPERMVLMAFRGVAKSWITAAYALWCLYCNPQLKIMVVSGSKSRATAFTNFCLQLVREVPELKFLMPQPHQRQSSTSFDVGPARPDQNPSLFSLGVMSQTAGWRADVIVPDDVETATNSLTVVMRDKIKEAVKELESIIKPGGRIVYLGTPHTEDSLYIELKKRSYMLFIFPARYPTREQLPRYGKNLSKWILTRLAKDPSLAGKSTEPTRFDEEDLTRRSMAMTSAEFALQFMLDTSLADAERYPLKLRDLIVMALDPRRAPDHIVWGMGDHLVNRTLPLLGFQGDLYYGPQSVADTTSEYTRVVGGLDISGRGADETALAIVAELNGMLCVLFCMGLRGGATPENLTMLAQACVRFGMHKLRIESNFGDGMFAALLAPVLQAEWDRENTRRRAINRANPVKAGREEEGGTEIEEVRAFAVQKELRILSVLEPIAQQHRIVVDVQMVEADYASIKVRVGAEDAHRYALMFQYTHLTREKDALGHDDRLDALSIAVSDFAEQLGVDPIGMSTRKSAEREEEELEGILADADEIGGWGSNKHSMRMEATRPRAR